MADNTIKEFLVGLGFHVDQNGLDKFGKGIDTATKFAVGLGEAALAAAVAVAAAVVKMSESFDQLYWQSQRLGSSATDIKSFGYALSQLGGSAQGAQNSLENLAEFSKSSPGAAHFLQSLGVSPKDLGNATATARDLERTFKTMPYYRAKAFASVIGIDPISLQAMERDTGQYETQFKAMALRMGKLFGEHFDDTAGEGNKSMTKLRELKMEFGMMFDFAMLAVLEKVIPLLTKFEKWVEDMALGKQLSGTAGIFQHMLTDVMALIKALADLAASPAMQAFGAAMGSAIDHALKGLVHLIRMVNDVLAGHWGDAGNEASALVGEAGAATGAVAGGVIGTIANMGAGSSGADKPSVKKNAATAMAYFKSMNMSDVQAGGLTAMLFSESGLDPNRRNDDWTGKDGAFHKGSGAYGIAQWLTKDRIADFRKVFGHDIHGSSLQEQLKFVVYEMQHKYNKVWKTMYGESNMARVAGAGIHGYEAPGFFGEIGDNGRAMDFLNSNPFGGAPLGAKAGKGVTIHQHTEIHAHGGGSKEVAAAVTSKQAEVNQKLVSDASVFAF